VDVADRLYRLLGQYIKSARLQRHLTQEELAAYVGLTRTSINNIEHGRQRIQIHTLYALADALQTRPAALLPRAALPAAPLTDQQLDALLEGANEEYEEDERAWIRTVLAEEESDGDGELDRLEGADPGTD
jgi:transcriptional regulator with XRE-family HTH domain